MTDEQTVTPAKPSADASAGAEADRPHAPSTPRSHDTPEWDDEIHLLELVNVLLRRWKLVVGLPIGAAFMAAVISLVIPPTFTATTAFVPEMGPEGRLSGGIAGLAGQLGMTLATEGGQTAQFYAEVLKSPEIMNRILLSRFADPRSAHNPLDSVMLLSLLEVEGNSPADSLYRARKKLNGLVSTRVDNQTNIVTLSIDSHYPVLAAAVANRFIEHLNEFNAKTRQSQARERRRFIEARLAEAEGELENAEGAMRRFYEQNRTWEQSPQLRFEQERLQRRVQTRLEVVLTLRREYETARIGEVNDTPVITVIHAAATPQQRAKPKRKLLVVLAFTLAGVLAVLGAFGWQFVERTRQYDEATYAEFTQLRSQMWNDVKRLLRPTPRG